jgi:hypothetical protein
MTRGRIDESAAMAGLHEHDALLAAFLEATNRLDLRALRNQAASVEIPEPVNVEAQVEIVATEMLDAEAPQSAAPTFTLRRANLTRA